MTHREIIARALEEACADAASDHRQASTGECVAAILADLDKRGLCIVPKEPTEAMWTAGRGPIMARDMKLEKQDLERLAAPWNPETWYRPEMDGKRGFPAKGDTAVWIYRAMISAAPK